MVPREQQAQACRSISASSGCVHLPLTPKEPACQHALARCLHGPVPNRPQSGGLRTPALNGKTSPQKPAGQLSFSSVLQTTVAEKPPQPSNSAKPGRIEKPNQTKTSTAEFKEREDHRTGLAPSCTTHGTEVTELDPGLAGCARASEARPTRGLIVDVTVGGGGR